MDNNICKKCGCRIIVGSLLWAERSCNCDPADPENKSVYPADSLADRRQRFAQADRESKEE